MSRIGSVLCLLLLTAAAFAAPKPPQNSQAFPKTLINARYVYVTSYDGDQFNPNLLPEDRQAIADVQDAIREWGHYILVYRAEQADMILAVQKRGSEDVLAVYDPTFNQSSTYLWRAMGRGGLDQNELPIFGYFRVAVENASK
ncbi:MAG: hypothetical protein LAO03_17150 [Acidobacteriia bacterium]|nr:hypothetical protein [Terriglobia bacterium]